MRSSQREDGRLRRRYRIRPRCRKLSVRGFDIPPGGVLEASGHDDNEIDQRPDAEAAKGQQHQDACAHLADIEAVDSERTQKETLQNRGYETFITNGDVVHTGPPVLSFCPG